MRHPGTAREQSTATPVCTLHARCTARCTRPTLLHARGCGSSPSQLRPHTLRPHTTNNVSRTATPPHGHTAADTAPRPGATIPATLSKRLGVSAGRRTDIERRVHSRLRHGLRHGATGGTGCGADPRRRQHHLTMGCGGSKNGKRTGKRQPSMKVKVQQAPSTSPAMHRGQEKPPPSPIGDRPMRKATLEVDAGGGVPQRMQSNRSGYYLSGGKSRCIVGVNVGTRGNSLLSTPNLFKCRPALPRSAD